MVQPSAQEWGWSRVLAAVVAGVMLVLTAPLGGCDGKASEIRAAMKQLTEAVERQDGDAVVSMYSRSTIECYDDLVRHARESDRGKTLSLPMWERSMVLMMRNRFSGPELKRLDGRSCIKMMVERGWWGIDTGEEDYGKIRVSANTGWMEVKEPDRRIFRSRRSIWQTDDNRKAYNVRFYLEEGMWKLDETSLVELWNKMLKDEMRMFSGNEHAFLEAIESEVSGKDVPNSIWDKPKLPK